MGVLRSHFPRNEATGTFIPDRNGLGIGPRRSKRLISKPTANSRKRTPEYQPISQQTLLNRFLDNQYARILPKRHRGTANLEETARRSNTPMFCLPTFRQGRSRTVGRHRRVSSHHFRRHLVEHLRPPTVHSRVTPKQPRKQAQYINDLHIPTPLPYVMLNSRSPSTYSYAVQARWTFDDEMLSLQETRKPLARIYEPIEKYAFKGRPAMNMAPTLECHVPIYLEIGRLIQRFQESCLCLPEDWGPIDGVDLDLIARETANSIQSDVSSTPSVQTEEPIPSDLYSPSEITREISIIPSLETSPHDRSRWVFLHYMQPAGFSWKLLKRADLKLRDERRRGGDMTLNESSYNFDLWPGNALLRFLTFSADTEILDANKVISLEIDGRLKIGQLIADVLSTDDIPVKLCRWALNHSKLNPAPTICGVVGRPTYSALQWDDRVTPVLFCAQDIYGDEAEAAARVALSVHLTLTILILYYLDTRQQTDQPLETWMIIYSVTYDETQLRFQANYPVFRLEKRLSSSAMRGEWGCHSTSLNVFRYPFEFDQDERSMVLALLLRIQSHNRFILRKLQAWEGFERAVSPLLSGRV